MTTATNAMPPLLEASWESILSLLPPVPELDRMARETGAVQRFRKIKNAGELLRILLSYGFCDQSLRSTSAWSKVNGTANISDVAVLQQLRKSEAWLERLIAHVLESRSGPGTTVLKGLSLRIVDATAICVPGSTTTDYRVHLAYHPQTCRIQSAELTDGTGGERLTRFDAKPGELYIADRAYAHRKGFAWVLNAGAHFIVRMNWHLAQLQQRDGSPFDLFSALRQLPAQGCQEFEVMTEPDDANGIPALPGRLVAMRKSPEAAAKARKKAQHEASRKSREINPLTLEACDYIFVLTSLPADMLSADGVLQLYRLRWQVELEFKRLKSLLNLDNVRAKEPAVVKAYLLAKLLGALLIEELLSFSPLSVA